MSFTSMGAHDEKKMSLKLVECRLPGHDERIPRRGNISRTSNDEKKLKKCFHGPDNEEVFVS